MSPIETHDVGSGFRAVLHGVFVLYAVVSPAVALFAVLCGCISVLAWLVLCRAECLTTAAGHSPHCCEHPGHCSAAFLAWSMPCTRVWHGTLPRVMEQAQATTSNHSAGLISHFSAPLSFAFSRANSLGQCSFTADCGCIWKLCAKSHLGEVRELKITWSCP